MTSRSTFLSACLVCAAALLCAPADAASSHTASLAGSSWELTNLGKTSLKPEEAARYTLQFDPSGITFVIQADCNSGKGTFTADQEHLVFSPIALTRAMCPAGSLSDRYVAALGTVIGFALRNGMLRMETTDKSNRMRFRPVAAK